MQVILAFQLDLLGDHRAVCRELRTRGYVRILTRRGLRTRMWSKELPDGTNLLLHACGLRLLFENLGGVPERVILTEAAGAPPTVPDGKLLDRSLSN